MWNVQLTKIRSSEDWLVSVTDVYDFTFCRLIGPPLINKCVSVGMALVSKQIKLPVCCDKLSPDPKLSN